MYMTQEGTDCRGACFG